MKKYVVCKLYDVNLSPSCIAHFETAQEAVLFAQLSHTNDPDHSYAVYAAFCVAG